MVSTNDNDNEMILPSAQDQIEEKCQNGDNIKTLKENQLQKSEDSEKPPKNGENGVHDNGLAVEGPEDEEVTPSTSDNNNVNGTVATNGHNGENGNGHAAHSSDSVECIELDDDDDVQEIDEDGKEPPSKKAKVDEDESESKDDKKKDGAELTSPEALLNKLEEYVTDAINSKKNVDRKILDALLGAINVQVQKEPLSVRKLILDKKLVLPNTISFPPSKVVDMLIEHDPEFPLAKVITKMFGEDRPKLSDAEKKERQNLKAQNPAPHMTKLLMDIGQDLVQESTYCDIVHARNLPETPKNVETYKQVAAQLKPVWEALRKKNEPYKLKMLTCQVCGFRTESRIVLQNHRATSHFKGGKFQCAMCPEFDTNEQRLLNHYLECHFVIATKEDPQAKYPCLICEEDFAFKGLRDQHMKTCKKDYTKVRNIMAPKSAEDTLMINRWLWDRPPVDPTILQQQQAAQAQQQKKQQLQQAAAAAMRKNTPQAAAQQTQMLQQHMMQQRLRQAQAAMMNVNGQNGRNMISNNNLIAAMQQHLQRTSQQQQRGAQQLSSQLTAAAAAMYHKNLAAGQAAAKNSMLAATAAQQAQQLRNKMLAAKAAGSPAASSTTGANTCEICDQSVPDKDRYLNHLQTFHRQMRGKTGTDMTQGAPLACSRCRDRFWTYEGLERHLVMAHGLVTADLLQKAQKKEDGGRCKLCGKQYAFNMLQHLVADHQVKLCSAEIMYSCDVCSFKCSSYQKLESHLSTVHPKGGEKEKDSNGTGEKKGEDCITLDD